LRLHKSYQPPMKRLFKILKWTFGIIIGLVIALTVVTVLYMRKETFGSAPEGARLEALQKSPNFKDGHFQNIHETPELTEGVTMTELLWEFFFQDKTRRYPLDTIPSAKVDLLSLPLDQDVLVWFGHSSFYIQLDGKRILSDPVFSGNASPVPGTTEAFAGTDRYAVEDFPPIDYLFLTHDHYDHVDYETLIKLKSKVRKVICGLGNGAHFERWGYPSEIVFERDWGQSIELDSGFIAHVKTARHFSGRGFDRNNTQWASYLLETPTMKIYLGGDSGYDTHYAEIGAEHGPIDLAILDNGQYDLKWRYIHTHPQEVIQATLDLKAKRLFPVHSSKFVLANHAWDEPLIRVSEFAQASNVPLVTPIIGELVYLKDNNQKFKPWWVGVQ
jgi:L-ascorbate metabolism protein UlaG (beta-lactamase superfamily)